MFTCRSNTLVALEEGLATLRDPELRWPAGASLPSSNTPVSLSGSGMPSAQPSHAPSMQQGMRTLLRHISPEVGDTAPQLYSQVSVI